MTKSPTVRRTGERALRPGRKLGEVFERARAEGRAAFIAYLTAGDPDLATTERLLPELGRAGVDIVELGVPFSDPIADGPVIQRATERAITSGATLERIFELARRARLDADCPSIVLFSYLNPIHRFGYARAASVAAESGIDGFLLTDLPIDQPESLHEELSARGLATIPLLSPTSARSRLAAARECGSGFAYYISRTGVTGEQVNLSTDLAQQVARVRRAVPLPVVVGFGISTPAQVAAVAAIADGVVVGSAIVAEIERAEGKKVVERVARFVRPLAAACRKGRR